jgi:hypothetical protein
MRKLISRRRFLALTGGILGGAAVAGPCSFAHTGAPNHGGYPDALTHYALDMLKGFTSWLGGARGYIGEVGWPHNRGTIYDQARWRDMMRDYWFPHANAKNLWVTTHGCTEFRQKNFWANVYQPKDVYNGPRALSRALYRSAVVEANRSTASYKRGLNFNGGQRWLVGTFSVNNPGTFNDDYWYPGVTRDDPDTNKNSFEYLKSRGMELVRLGFRWERMQPTPGQALSSTEVSRYKRSLDSCASAGLKAIVDLHNYGGFHFTASTKTLLNTTKLPIGHLVDFWRRMVDAVGSHQAVVAFDLMNEPNREGGVAAGGYASPSKAWEAATQKCVDAIRTRGNAKKIMVPLYFKSSHRDGPWIVNGGDIMYTTHCYFWRSGETGGYEASYDKENSYRASEGY